MNILFCNCSFVDIINPEIKAKIWSALCASEHNLCAVDDLCGAVVDQTLPADFDLSANWVVVACYPRTIINLLKKIGLPSEQIEVINLIDEDLEGILRKLKLDKTSANQEFKVTPQTWAPWFPIIDQDRCTNCKQCIAFCPFGVYELIERKVVVKNPKNCKNNCPACARVCPSQAIIFPKCPDKPICGCAIDDVAEDDILEQSDDLHDILARRNAFAKARKGEL